MNYKFSTLHPSSHFIEIEVTLQNNHLDVVEVQLPAWRPGRYELQNFAKNLQYFRAFDQNGNQLSTKKLTKDRWIVQTSSIETVVFTYNYYANEQNAGSSFLDNSMLYINPINCCVYVEGRIEERVTLQIQGKPNQQVAGGLASVFNEGFHHLEATDFHHLVDSPLMTSEKLQHKVYNVDETPFHIWVAGNIEIPWEKVILDFAKFTKIQIDVFGEFPEKDFHFLLWVLPTPFFHGVEHRNSTMMVLGPDIQPFEAIYTDLLGLASHELFHAWNICKIRPAELTPYDYTKENYFKTCFIAEGITTFYGDWMLHRSGVFTDSHYLNELETCYRRHFENADNAKQSLLESSYDLWLDGYSKSIPGRKVSVYHKGAIAAQLLNHYLKNKNGKSLDDIMKTMWEKYGKTGVGYTYQDYIACCESIAEENLSSYFSECIEGTASLWYATNAMLLSMNLRLIKSEDGKVSLIQV